MAIYQFIYLFESPVDIQYYIGKCLFVSTLTNTWSWVVHILQIYIQTAHTVQMTAYSNSDMTLHNFLIIYMFVYNIHFYDDEIHINKNICDLKIDIFHF